MSGNDQMNWDDDLDFESLADEHDVQMGNGEAGDSASDLQDLSYDATADADDELPVDDATDAPVAEEAAETEAAESRQPSSYQRRSGVPSIVMGFLFGLAAIASGLGLGGAVLLVSDLDLRSFWNPEALMQIEPWLDLQNNPLNVFYLVAVGIIALTWLISWRVQKFGKSANRNLRETENLLGKLTALRLDNEAAWQSTAFKQDAAVENFVCETLGAWRLQIARQDKNLALEGELRRLEQAAQSGSRVDMAANFEHPLVGRLADHVVRLYDAGEAAANEVEAVRTKDQHESGSIIGVIQDARSWNRHTLDQVGVQAASVNRVAGILEEAATAAKSAVGGDAESQRLAQVSVTLRELKGEVETLASAVTEVPEATGRDVATQLTDLTERGGKLAFQIAMEVASLGQRGERLLPMAQALEELTTEFRESTGQITGEADRPDPAKYPEMIRKLDGLIGLLDAIPPTKQSPLEARADDLTQVARKASADLEMIAGTFNHQAERLTELGTSFAALSGVSFDPGDIAVGKPDNPPDGSLELSQMDPFAVEADEPQSAADIDPFATADSVLSLGGEQEQDGGFSSDVTPGLETDFFSSTPEPEKNSESDVETVDPFATTETPAVAASPTIEPMIEPTVEPTLPSTDDRVYDLVEFGAQRLEDSSGSAESEDRIYDLAEFDAVGLD